jgi:alpha-beta hydrolase superfamily lysophospholipase
VILDAQPADGLVDEPVTWMTQGVPADATVRLTISGTDAAGRQWRSSAAYAVGDDGRLLIEDLDRPWWSMTTDVRPAVRFTDPLGEWVCTAEASCGSDTARTTVRRRFGGGRPSRELSGDRWRLSVWPASGPASGVLLVPGSTGIAPLAPRAALLAAHGYSTAVLGYMHEPGLPQSMRQIPVEVVAEGMRAFGALDEVDGDRLVVWAQSVATELVLTALSDPDPPPVRGIVAISPSDVVWQALGSTGPPPKASSLTRAGVDLPWVPMRSERLIGQALRHALLRRLPGGASRSTAMRLGAAYADRDVARAAEAAIPVERIDAPMLLIAGDSDAMWPSVSMAAALAARRGHRPTDRMLVLPGTGHFVSPPATPTTVDRNADLVSGGTPEATGHGQRAAWDAALAFLQDVTGRP